MIAESGEWKAESEVSEKNMLHANGIYVGSRNTGK
jgi:hypothetical protein